MAEKKACIKCGSTDGRVYRGLCGVCRKKTKTSINPPGVKKEIKANVTGMVAETTPGAFEPLVPPDIEGAIINIMSVIHKKVAELKTLHAAILMLNDVNGMGITVPGLAEIIAEVEA